MPTKNKDLTSLDAFIESEIGKRGTEKRENFEVAYDAFKLGVIDLQNLSPITSQSRILNTIFKPI